MTHGNESRTPPKRRKHLGSCRRSAELGHRAVAAWRRRRCVSVCRPAPPIRHGTGADSRKRSAGLVGVIRNGSTPAPAGTSTCRNSGTPARRSNSRSVRTVVSRERCACVDADDRQHLGVFHGGPACPFERAAHVGRDNDSDAEGLAKDARLINRTRLTSVGRRQWAVGSNFWFLASAHCPLPTAHLKRRV